ncbi:MAG: insulinase family protein [Planctomycetes bacterium]|nr:insulinase family protein [Planctomycetota bacterium]
MTPSAVHEFALDNGFRSLLVRREGLPIVAAALFYTVGSRDERTGESGVSHFLEHMMFKGTTRYAKGEIDLITTRLGGSNNAYTDHDTTAYHFSLASDRWQVALDIEASRMRDCLFDDAEFAAEKSVVLEELAMGQDDPWRCLWETTEALAFRVHPYHRPIIGYRGDLERLTPDDMRAYYRRHYGPNRAYLVVVGDVDIADTERRIASTFAEFTPVPERDAPLPEPARAGELRGAIRAPGSIARIAMAAPVGRMGERDDFVLDIVSVVLGSGRSSRLHRRLVLDEELATSISTSNEPRLDPGLFWIMAELRPGADPERAELILREELDKLREDGVTAEERKRAIMQLRSGFLFEGETALGEAMRIGQFETGAVGGRRRLDDVLRLYDEIGRRELRGAIERWLAPDSWTVVWSLPEGQRALRPRPLPKPRPARAKAGRGHGTVRVAGRRGVSR